MYILQIYMLDSFEQGFHWKLLLIGNAFDFTRIGN